MPFEKHPPPTFDTPEYLFRGKYRLKVSRAKEPEDISYENLEKVRLGEERSDEL
jgi:hypothetical protein